MFWFACGFVVSLVYLGCLFVDCFGSGFLMFVVMPVLFTLLDFWIGCWLDVRVLIWWVWCCGFVLIVLLLVIC